jgi:hypothetical protein
MATLLYGSVWWLALRLTDSKTSGDSDPLAVSLRKVRIQMKVIFLDVDGVLNCKKTPNPRKLPYVVDKRLLARFRRLLEQTGAKVVLSSTWRYDPAGVFSAKHWGVPFIDITPDMPKRPRRDEILAWLKKAP